MIHYRLGGRFYHDEAGDDYALTESEWKKLKCAKRSIRLYTESGMPIVIRKQNSRDETPGAADDLG